jgi:hypothetical protein
MQHTYSSPAAPIILSLSSWLSEWNTFLMSKPSKPSNQWKICSPDSASFSSLILNSPLEGNVALLTANSTRLRSVQYCILSSDVWSCGEYSDGQLQLGLGE